jgi:DNA-binding response OmpR family regulator
MNALLVATDPDEAAVLSFVLRRAGLTVSPISQVEGAPLLLTERPADLLLVADGRQVTDAWVRQFRSQSQVPLVLILDASVPERESVTLLEAGADLIVVRPVGTSLLVAQVRALMRRAAGLPYFSLPSLQIGGVTLDPADRSVRVADRPSRQLTHLEFRLLYTLMTHPGRVVPSDALVEGVWGYTGAGDRHLVRGLVSRLRSKVEPDPSNPEYVLTVPGVGYRFEASE